MKKTILTIATLVLLTSCSKQDELQPVVTPTPVVVVTPTEPCLDVCGTIIAMKHNYDNTVNITSELTLATSCDTVVIVRVHRAEL